jgi:hypothetical protein
MPIWMLLLQMCWVVGFLGLGFKLCLLSAEMFGNLIPEANKWKLVLLKKTPAREQLNERGQRIRRQYYRFAWIMAAYFVGGVILFNL